LRCIKPDKDLLRKVRNYIGKAPPPASCRR